MAAAAIYYSVLRPIPVLSDRGATSPYYVRGYFNSRVFFRHYVGDGLMGSYHYTPLADSDRKLFKVIDFEVKMDDDDKGFIPVAVGGDRYYHFGRSLPFPALSEKILQMYRSPYGPIALITEKSVYFWNRQKYVDLVSEKLGTQNFMRLPSPESAHGSYYFKNDSRVFYGDGYDAHIITEADSASFQLKGIFGYATDKNYVYFAGKKISDADSGTFEIVFHSGESEQTKNSEFPAIPYESEYARDKNHVFKSGKVLQGIDPKTFRP